MPNSIQRALVTGALGFVGSELVRHLVRRRWKVTVFDNQSRGRPDNVAGLDARIVRGDIRDADSVRRCVRNARPRIVFHLAAMHFLPECNSDPAGCILNNVVGTENVLDACARARIPRVLAPTSMAVYPISDAALRETDPVGPYDIYGETKVMNEMQMRRWSARTGGVAISVRLANVYGPRETNPHVIPAIMEQLKAGERVLRLGNMSAYRDYIHSSDVAAAMVTMGRMNLDPGFHVFNLGTGEEHSVRDIIRILSRILGRTIAVRTDAGRLRRIERRHLRPDMSKFRHLSGWRPRVGFETGLRDLCGWYGLIEEKGRRCE